MILAAKHNYLPKLLLSTLLTACVMVSMPVNAAPSRVALTDSGGKWHLTVNGKPFTIKGAGGQQSLTELKGIGGNCIRTWGADNLGPVLRRAHKLGIMVTVGIWLGHTEQGFNYNDPAQVKAQYDEARSVILKYRNNPAVLMWGIGNEMEGYGTGDSPVIWRSVEQIAAMAHRLDPNHPTMTVTAEIGGRRVAAINQYCPSIDVEGINSYAGGPSLAKRYLAAGGKKPFVVTEYGPPGQWESAKTNWGVSVELSSTAKADWYRKTNESTILGNPLCLGGFAFAWGYKQEATATWYGMFLPDGRKLAAVDTMQELWSHRAPSYPCPVINSLSLPGDPIVTPGAVLHPVLDAKNPSRGSLTVHWVFQEDPGNTSVGGASQAVPPTFPAAIIKSSERGATIQVPEFRGNFRIFAYVYNHHNGAAVANIPIHVTGNIPPPAAKSEAATLPLVIYGAGATTPSPYTASGYMGDAAAIKMDPNCTDDPHDGTSCLKVEYNAPDQWGGVVWQDPPNDWGKAPGGWNLQGAKQLTFWARGAQGGETVKFLFGVLGRSVKYYDTATGQVTETLGKAWHKYAIDVSGMDLSRIKTGFGWSLAGSGKPVTFFLDDIKFTSGGATSVDPVNSKPVARLPIPLVIYNNGEGSPVYAPSGFMGDAKAISLDPKCTVQPHTGKLCMKVQFTGKNDWGGVVWQNPANNWGKVAGGKNLSDATRLQFWARGSHGGEKVNFLLGVLKRGVRYHDSGTASKTVSLTTTWKKYSISLAGLNLSRIVTAFGWSVAATVRPVTFYLDDIEYVH